MEEFLTQKELIEVLGILGMPYSKQSLYFAVEYEKIRGSRKNSKSRDDLRPEIRSSHMALYFVKGSAKRVIEYRMKVTKKELSKQQIADAIKLVLTQREENSRKKTNNTKA